VKKKPKLNKKTLRNLKLKLKKASERKAAPMLIEIICTPSNGSSC